MTLYQKRKRKMSMFKNISITLGLLLMAGLAGIPANAQVKVDSIKTTNGSLLSLNRFGVGVSGLTGIRNNVTKGVNFRDANAAVTWDVFTVNGRKPFTSRTSLGLFASTEDHNFKHYSVGPQVNYSVGPFIVGLGYDPARNAGKTLLGLRI